MARRLPVYYSAELRPGYGDSKYFRLEIKLWGEEPSGWDTSCVLCYWHCNPGNESYYGPNITTELYGYKAADKLRLIKMAFSAEGQLPILLQKLKTAQRYYFDNRLGEYIPVEVEPTDGYVYTSDVLGVGSVIAFSETEAKALLFAKATQYLKDSPWRMSELESRINQFTSGDEGVITNNGWEAAPIIIPLDSLADPLTAINYYKERQR